MIKKRLSIFLSILCVICFIFSFNIYNQTVSAEAIDYTALTFPERTIGAGNISEDMIFKIHCPNLRTQIDSDGRADYVDEYVHSISFKASSGCQIYFIDGKAYDLADSYDGDYQTDIFKGFYDILQYDSVGHVVYLKFKNLANLNANGGDLQDLTIKEAVKPYANKIGMLYQSEVESQMITEITPADAYFNLQPKAVHGGYGFINNSIFAVEFTFKVNQKVSHLVNNVTFTLNKGADIFTIHSNSASADGFTIYNVIASGNADSLLQDIQIKATINKKDGSTMELLSSETNIMTCWELIADNNFSDPYYTNILTEVNKKTIKKFVESYRSNFLFDIQATQGHYIEYNPNNNIKNERLIFRVPLINDVKKIYIWYVQEGLHYNNYLWYIDILVYTNGNYKCTAGKQRCNDNGEAIDSEIIFEPALEKALENEISIFTFNGYLYLRINNDNVIYNYIPYGVKFNATCESYDPNAKLECNSVGIIYDEYNAGLLSEIDTLRQKVTQLEKDKSELATRIDTLNTEINVLNTKIEELKLQNQDLQNAYESSQENERYLLGELEKKQLELNTLKEEYQTLSNSLNGDVSDLVNLVNSYRTKNSDLENEISKLKEENANLKKQIPKEEKEEKHGVSCSSAIGSGYITIPLLLISLAIFMRRKHDEK